MTKLNDESPDFQERWEAQLRKGTLEMAALASLWGKRLYGLEILRALASEAQLALGEGTIYPILNRLKTEGLLVSEWVEAEAGRVRLCSMAGAWVGFTRGLGCLLAPVLTAKELTK